jgi:hypothetical protein
MMQRKLILAALALVLTISSASAQENSYRLPQMPEMSRSLLNIAKRPLPRLTLRGVSLTSKDAVS